MISESCSDNKVFVVAQIYIQVVLTLSVGGTSLACT